MGHRRHSAPRRGSLAYLPRGRAKSMEARIRAWPKVNSDEPKLLAHAGFKAGCVQIVNIDDREKTPNHGKQLVSLGTVIVTPPVLIVGIRGYSKDPNGKHAEFDLYADNLPKNISKLFKNKDKENLLDYAEKSIKKIIQSLVENKYLMIIDKNLSFNYKNENIKTGFNYLINMPLYHLTDEKIIELENIITDLQKQYDELNIKTIEEIWLNELKELKKKL